MKQEAQIFVSSEKDTMLIARLIANKLARGTKIGLSGELGAGKTTFVKGFVTAFDMHKHAVTSPTFTIMNEYGISPRIFHADLYRIESEEDLIRTGIYDVDMNNGFLLIEWPEKFKSLANYLDLSLSFHITNRGRRIRINDKNGLLAEWIEMIKNFKRGRKYGFSS